MKFLSYIETLKADHISDCRYRPNRTLLIGHFDGKSEEAATHIIYSPMSDTLIQHLVNSYKGTIPQDLISIYKTMNGCALCAGLTTIRNYQIPMHRLAIYGIPVDSPYKDFEPFNISIEDEDRPRNAPKTWLKFGSYKDLSQGEIHGAYDLFVDVENGTVDAVTMRKKKANLKHPEYRWTSIDLCLCALYEHAVRCLSND